MSVIRKRRACDGTQQNLTDEVYVFVCVSRAHAFHFFTHTLLAHLFLGDVFWGSPINFA